MLRYDNGAERKSVLLMTKNDYRLFFAQCKPFLKMSFFLKRAGITTGCFSLFMKGESHDYCLSYESLERIYVDIIQTLENVA